MVLFLVSYGQALGLMKPRSEVAVLCRSLIGHSIDCSGACNGGTNPARLLEDQGASNRGTNPGRLLENQGVRRLLPIPKHGSHVGTANAQTPGQIQQVDPPVAFSQTPGQIQKVDPPTPGSIPMV